MSPIQVVAVIIAVVDHMVAAADIAAAVDHMAVVAAAADTDNF